ncbi:MAG: ABC transporter ATP-binding protein [SAR324 cluster bacterium]|nr:ABC transporter ATP-binding protein [SAR324 cluster bacterium]
MLKLHNLVSAYGNILALQGVSLHVKPSEIVTILGSNGAGKTTLLMAIAGLVPPRQGEILWEGRPIQQLTPDQIKALGIGLVPEGRHIFPEFTVLENLRMGAYLRRDREHIQEDLERMMELFPILCQRQSQLGGTLSGGEQQMLAIARALMGRPQLLLLDEPSLGLAPLVVQKIFEILRQTHHQQQTTILLVEQNAHLALQLADRGYLLGNGKIQLTDTAANLLGNEAVQRVYLGG